MNLRPSNLKVGDTIISHQTNAKTYFTSTTDIDRVELISDHRRVVETIDLR